MEPRLHGGRQVPVAARHVRAAIHHAGGHCMPVVVERHPRPARERLVGHAEGAGAQGGPARGAATNEAGAVPRRGGCAVHSDLAARVNRCGFEARHGTRGHGAHQPHPHPVAAEAVRTKARVEAAVRTGLRPGHGVPAPPLVHLEQDLATALPGEQDARNGHLASVQDVLALELGVQRLRRVCRRGSRSVRLCRCCGARDASDGHRGCARCERTETGAAHLRGGIELHGFPFSALPAKRRRQCAPMRATTGSPVDSPQADPVASRTRAGGGPAVHRRYVGSRWPGTGRSNNCS